VTTFKETEEFEPHVILKKRASSHESVLGCVAPFTLHQSRQEESQKATILEIVVLYDMQLLRFVRRLGLSLLAFEAKSTELLPPQVTPTASRTIANPSTREILACCLALSHACVMLLARPVYLRACCLTLLLLIHIFHPHLTNKEIREDDGFP
jgi:hypothetical protein